MTRDESENFKSGAGVLALLTGLLGAPFVWLMQMQALYLFAVWICKGSKAPLYLTTVIALVLVACVCLVAWRCWQRSGRSWPGDEGGALPRSRFMAALGVLTSALFFLLILAQGIANFFFSPCVR
ncbi:MAG: hypothetical protein JOZ52_13845 [Acidobacteria bacterium]|nr:hypothetical protein [Acidobacteriota bacterium]